VAASISVIIPTRNRVTLLQQVVREYYEQVASVEGELIVVDDGSDDTTPDVLEVLEGQLPHLTWTSLPPRGPAAARNEGIELAESSLLLFTGDDMVPAAGVVAGHVATHDMTTGAAVVGRVEWDRRCRPSRLMRLMAPNGPFFNFRKLESREEPLHRFFYTANLSIAMETLGEERFDERFSTAAFEDTELGFRLRQRGVDLVYRPDLVVYHNHPMSARDLRQRLKTLFEGQRVLGQVQPSLSASLMDRLKAKLLELFVAFWLPFDR
jgi:glycosyltransferase involved in cell wall biosynthesis